MSEKILLFEDNARKQDFLKAVEEVRTAAHDLIMTFEAFQEFKRIGTLEEFEQLCKDPVKYFDETLKSNVSLNMTGNRQPDPQVLADLFGIERQNFISLIKGLPVTETCKPCNTSKVIRKKGKPALSYNEFLSFKSFLTYEQQAFNLNTEAIANRLEQFKSFAQTPEEIELYQLFTNMVQQLNNFTEKFPISLQLRQSLKKELRLFLSEGMTGKFMVNPQVIVTEIMNLKSRK